MMKVSVLIPCYNAEETLEDTLETVFAQSFSDYEVVAVDDGSTDTTDLILVDWAKRHSNLRVIKITHGGIIEALNQGLDACQGEYIARMDADDRMAPQRLEKQVELLNESPEVWVASCLTEGFPPEDVREGFQIYLDWLNVLQSDADIRREMFVESPLPHPSVMFRRQEIVNLGGYQEHGWPEDYDLWLRVYLAGGAFAKVPEVMLSWREHPNRLTRTDSRYSLENFIRAKAYYLALGPLKGKDAIFIWGAGMHGRRLSKYLIRDGLPVEFFVDIDPKKIGRTRRGRPIIAVEALLEKWNEFENPALLAAVGARGARKLIRERLEAMGFEEGKDWWGAA